MDTFNSQRRCTLAMLLAAAADPARSLTLGAPSTSKFIIAGNPGSSTDSVGRRLQTIWFDHRIGKYDVENVPGGGGMTAINRLLAEPANSNSLLLSTSGALCVTPIVSNVGDFDPEQDISPLAIIGKVPFVLFTSIKNHHKNFEDFVRYFQKTGEILNYGVAPIYGANHIGGHALIKKLGIEGKAIPYRQTSQFLLDVSAQRVPLGISTALTIKGMLDQELLRPLAVMSVNRLKVLPSVPGMRELGLTESAFEGWVGIFHRTKMAPFSIDKLRSSLRKVFLQNESLIDLTDLGYSSGYKDSQAASDFVHNEIIRYREIIKNMDLS